MKKPSNIKRHANEIDKYVGQRIRAGRMVAGLSQEELGAALGVSFQQIQKYEKGNNRTSCGALVLIAAELQVPLIWFFEDAPGMPKTDATGVKIGEFFSTKGASELAADFMRLDTARRFAVRTLASSL